MNNEHGSFKIVIKDIDITLESSFSAGQNLFKDRIVKGGAEITDNIRLDESGPYDRMSFLSGYLEAKNKYMAEVLRVNEFKKKYEALKDEFGVFIDYGCGCCSDGHTITDSLGNTFYMELD